MYSPIEATLLCYQTEQNDNGYDVEVTKKKTEVFVTLKSIAHTEFYEALRAGIKPRLIAMMYVQEYEEAFFEKNPPTHIVIDNVPYRIVREYQTDIDHTELTLEREERNEISYDD